MTICILKDVRLSFPDLWKPGNPPKDRPMEPGKFGCHGIIVPGSDAAQLAGQVFSAVAQEKFGPNWKAVIESIPKDKKCVRQGNLNLDQKGEVRNGYKDMLYIVAKNKVRPMVIASSMFNGKPVELTEDGRTLVDGREVDVGFQVDRPYGGCYINMKVDIYAMDKPGQGKTINATLLAVQYLRKGDAFGGGIPDASGFEDVGTPEGGGALDGGDPFGDSDIPF